MHNLLYYYESHYVFKKNKNESHLFRSISPLLTTRMLTNESITPLISFVTLKAKTLALDYFGFVIEPIQQSKGKNYTERYFYLRCL